MKRLLILLALCAAGCSSGRVAVTQSAPPATLARPTQVVVTDFAVDPGAVTLDSGIRARLERAQSGAAVTDLQAQTAQETQAALAQTLADKLGGYGLPVEHLPQGAAAPPGSLLVQGQITSIDQGNRTRRTLIGLGAGKSSVQADAQLYYVGGAAAPRLLQSFAGSADSGHMPGAAETMGAGAVAGHIATSAALTAGSHAAAERRRTPTEAEAGQVAAALARKIGSYAEAQGWLPPGAVQ